MEEDEFKDTEIGKIPKDWNVEKLIKHVDLIRGKEVGSNNYNNDNKGKRFIRIVDLSGSRDNILYTTSNNVIECNKDDILISFDGSPGIVATNFCGAISSGIRKIYFKDDSLNKKYTYYFLQTIYIQNIIKKFSTGVTIKHASKAIPNLIIIIPPLEEQKRIAYVLSKIENAIKIQDRIINTLQELKKSMMHELFTEGIGHTEFKDTEIGRIPKEWDVLELGKISNILMGQSPPGKTYNNDGKGIPFLQGKAEFGPFYPRPIKFTTSPLKIAESGSILISVRAPVGDVNIANINYCIGRGLASISVRKGSNMFLFYLLKYFKQNIEKEGTGSTFKAINKNKLKNFKIPFPPLEEQKKIADILSTIDNKISIEEDRKKYFEALFKTMINKLMTGQIRVKNLEMRE